MSLPKTVEVFTSVFSSEVRAGNIHFDAKGSTFQYASEYLAHAGAYPLSPSLHLTSGPYRIDCLGVFADSAPDRWGRRLVLRAQARQSMTDAEYLLAVSDKTRQGAIRFLAKGNH